MLSKGMDLSHWDKVMDKSYKQKGKKQKASFQPCTGHGSGHNGSSMPSSETTPW